MCFSKIEQFLGLIPKVKNDKVAPTPPPGGDSKDAPNDTNEEKKDPPNDSQDEK